MRKLIVFALMAASACSGGTEPAAKKQANGTPLIRFEEDVPLARLRVSDSSGELSLSIVRSGTGSRTSELNVYLLPPPARYVFDENTRKFQYFQHYELFPSATKLQAFADAQRRYAQLDNFVVLTFPGTYGTAGPPALHHDARIVTVINEAIDQLKSEVQAEHVNIVSQSAGAAVIAALLPRRTDLRCVVLQAGAYDFPALIRLRNWPTTYAGTSAPFSSIELVQGQPARRGRTIILTVDRKDVRVPATQTDALYAELKQNGENVTVERRSSADPEHHSLGLYPFDRLYDCIKGRTRNDLDLTV